MGNTGNEDECRIYFSDADKLRLETDTNSDEAIILSTNSVHLFIVVWSFF